MKDEGYSSGDAGSVPMDVKDKSKLFDIIDKFRELGINEDISLPQLVVVGDQSSGKSSLLEALTRLPFPVAGTLCTRFATQIVFRRTPPGEREQIKVSIIPDENTPDTQKIRLRAWTYDVEHKLTADIFRKLIVSASDAMGLPKPGETVSKGARFSDDLLKIELSGPNHTHFSVVDLPGIFQAATVLQTTEDVEMIEKLVKRYMHDSRTIILAVASSLHETANQKVFTLAKQADPKGLRTLGVLTKPDAIQKGDEGRLIEVARNKVTVLTHGWFVIRNRSTADINANVSLEERNRNEIAFFAERPWNQLAPERVGIVALEKFLRELLDGHVKNEFPNLVKELNNYIEDAEKELKVLGPRRETPVEQRRILLKLAAQYQSIANNAILGNYRDKCFKLDDKFKLRRFVATYSDEFAETILEQGHEVEFDDITAEHGGVNSDADIYSTIRDHHRASRGAELPGMVNPHVVQTLFQHQSQKWDSLAEAYIDRVIATSKEFTTALLKYVCPDTSLESRIASRLSEDIEEAYNRGRDELRDILYSEREGLLLTLDNGYAEKLEECGRIRQMLALRQIDDEGMADDFIGNLDRLVSLIHISNEQKIVNDIHDILKSYYIVARRRFVDNVAMQVVERHFLAREGVGASTGGPVVCFNPQWVGTLSDDELDMVAGEDRAVVARRAVLTDKLDRWKKAKRFAATVW